MSDATFRLGFPPGFRLEWDVWRFVIRPDPHHPPTFEELGPPGTVWLYSSDEAEDHVYDVPGWLTPALFGVQVGASGTFIVPYDLELREMRWYRVTVKGVLGSSEIINNTFSVVKEDGTALSEADSDKLTVANLFRDAWSGWLDATAFNTTKVKELFHPSTVWQTVTVALLERTEPWTKDTSQKGKVNQVGSTVLCDAWTTTKAGTSTGMALPFEVACALTLRTAAQQTGGPSHGRRNRGRAYLGGFSVAALSASTPGTFDTSMIRGMAQQFGTYLFHNLVLNSTYMPVVVTQAGMTTHEVTYIEVGAIPDSQRRRRNAQVEGYYKAWQKS